jgi:hypothetical protein
VPLDGTQPDANASDDGPPSDALAPPVDRDALLTAHAGRLNAAGSFAYEEEHAVRSDDVDPLHPIGPQRRGTTSGRTEGSSSTPSTIGG